MKKFIIILVVAFTLVLGVFLYINSSQDTDQEQIVLEKTLDISKEYASLRYKTDNVLIDAKSFEDYDNWNKEISDIIEAWIIFEEEALDLENSAKIMSDEKVSLIFIKSAEAYTKEEVTSVIDKAPTGKKIMTLAKHLGVDAKMAQLILNETQNMISREAYGEEGDVFQTLETRATMVKNASKVTVFVGTIALTGGTSAIAAGSTLSKAAVIVSGADLTLEITDDTAKIALGNKNKISAIVGDVRKITEPAAAILMVSTLPNNLVTGIDKLNAVVFGADQLNSTIQSGTAIGIKLPDYIQKESSQKMEVSILEKEEVNEWMKEQGFSTSPEKTEEIENILGIDSKKEENVSKILEKNEETKSEDKKGEDLTKPPMMGIVEYNELSDKEQFKSMKHVKQYFGEPNLKTADKNGRIVFIYLDRIKYIDGGSAGLRFTFYTLEDYKKISGSFGGWDDDDQNLWDASKGGFVGTSEVKDTDFFKDNYGF